MVALLRVSTTIFALINDDYYRSALLLCVPRLMFVYMRRVSGWLQDSLSTKSVEDQV